MYSDFILKLYFKIDEQSASSLSEQEIVKTNSHYY